MYVSEVLLVQDMGAKHQNTISVSLKQGYARLHGYPPSSIPVERRRRDF